ncbi:Uncharacterised protein [Escherichia coli]|nr:Uncharacterised protein [Escherichia coli]
MPLIAPIFRDERRLMQKVTPAAGCRLQSLCGEGQRQLCDP